jgi:hypothetical protein
MKVTARRIELQERRAKVAKMLGNRIPKSDIAIKLKVSPATITGDCKIIYQEIKDEVKKNAIDLKAIELRTIEEAMREAWAAWHRSTKIKRVHKNRETEDPEKGLITMKEETKEKLVGNPRYLEVIATLSKNRQELLGIKTPEEIRLKDDKLIIEVREATQADVDKNKEVD